MVLSLTTKFDGWVSYQIKDSLMPKVAANPRLDLTLKLSIHATHREHSLTHIKINKANLAKLLFYWFREERSKALNQLIN